MTKFSVLSMSLIGLTASALAFDDDMSHSMIRRDGNIARKPVVRSLGHPVLTNRDLQDSSKGPGNSYIYTPPSNRDQGPGRMHTNYEIRVDRQPAPSHSSALDAPAPVFTNRPRYRQEDFSQTAPTQPVREDHGPRYQDSAGYARTPRYRQEDFNQTIQPAPIPVRRTPVFSSPTPPQSNGNPDRDRDRNRDRGANNVFCPNPPPSNHFCPPKQTFADAVRDFQRREQDLLRQPQYFAHDATLDFGYWDSGLRTGYCQYNNNFNDNQFRYHNYRYRPTGHNCTYSPWYYYPQLPPYVTTTEIFIIGTPSYNCGYNNGYTTYGGYNSYDSGYGDSWRSYYEGDNQTLDNAISDIQYSFNQGRIRGLSDLVPYSGKVEIYVDGKYQYSMNADDFYSTLRDAVENVKTQNYQILDVRTNRDGDAKVIARHETEDPWGRAQTVYHTFYLRGTRDGFEIRGFGSSDQRP
jgi:hypothetical protein